MAKINKLLTQSAAKLQTRAFGKLAILIAPVFIK